MSNNSYAEPAQKLLAVLKPFCELRERLPVRSLQALLIVAANEGRTVGEISDYADLPNSSISRMLLDLGPRSRAGGEGLGLLDRKVHPTNLLKAQYYLSVKGRHLVNKALRGMPQEESK